MSCIEVDAANKSSSQSSGDGFHDDIAYHVNEREHQRQVDVGMVAVRKHIQTIIYF